MLSPRIASDPLRVAQLGKDEAGDEDRTRGLTSVISEV